MKALALMPFGEEFNDVYKSMEAACRQYSESDSTKRLLANHPRREQLLQLECTRIDQVRGGAFDITELLIESLRSATICIADITGKNQNVLWELGFAMALDKPVVVLTQKRAEVGFDLRNFRNIAYQRDQLAASLEQPLLEELQSIALQLPDPSAFPTHSSHAKALAMSTASPTYFLGADYTIQYMNEAAAALFETARVGRSWIGLTLRDFMNNFADRLKNLPTIERNLQIQTEQIRDLEKAGRPFDISRHNIETVILDSREYGTVVLQKTGVAVTDQAKASESIIGWVVSFNVVEPKDPQKFARFHEKHRNLIEGRLFADVALPPRISETQAQVQRQILQMNTGVPAGETVIENWINGGCQSPWLRQAQGYAEKQRAFEFSADIMKSEPRYGLTSLSFLPEWFFDYRKSDYIEMYTSGGDDGQLVGVFRMYPNHDITQYQDLEPWVATAAADGQTFADCGAYLHPKIKNHLRRQCLATLIGRATYLCEQSGQVYIYAQVPKQNLGDFESYLFQRAGKNFTCEGWSHEWVPILLKCLVYTGDEKVRNAWFATGGKAPQVDKSFLEGVATAHSEAEKDKPSGSW